MATTFKTLLPSDVVDSRTKLHENIPVTGTIVSGTYNNENIKTFSHGMFTSVYDYPYLSSSANHIFDITLGYDESSAFSGSTSLQNSKKINMYNQFAQVLLGYTSSTGDGIRKFENDLTLDGAGYMKEVFFVSLSRLLVKDQIKKGTFSMTLGCTTDGAKDGTAFGTPQLLTITDTSGSDQYFVNSPVGEYGILYATGAILNLPGNGDVTEAVGLLYYQAGVAVLTASVFTNTLLSASAEMNTASDNFEAMLTGSQISASADAIRHRIQNVQFNNTIELNSTVYFCRVNNTDFNYSANPTYVSSSKMVVKTNSQDLPVSYVTAVGLYSPDNELLAVAKLSEPLKKDPSTEFTLRVRLDY